MNEDLAFRPCEGCERVFSSQVSSFPILSQGILPLTLLLGNVYNYNIMCFRLTPVGFYAWKIWHIMTSSLYTCINVQLEVCMHWLLRLRWVRELLCFESFVGRNDSTTSNENKFDLILMWFGNLIVE